MHCQEVGRQPLVEASVVCLCPVGDECGCLVKKRARIRLNWVLHGFGPRPWVGGVALVTLLCMHIPHVTGVRERNAHSS